MLYQYQQDLLNSSRKNYIYPLGTGTGKTILSIHHYHKHAGNKKLIVVAPAQKVKEGGWDREIKKFCEYYKVSIEYEVLSYGRLKHANVDLETYLIFDECHYIKNYKKSQRSKIALNLTKQAFGYCLLSATPASNGYQDMGNYMAIFGIYKNGYSYEKAHAIKKLSYLGYPEIVEWKNTDYIDKVWKAISSPALDKNECIDLPDLMFEDVYFNPGEQYLILKKDRVLNEEIYDTSSKLIAGLRQLAGFNEKLEYLEEFRNSTDANILIFYNFKKEAEAIKKILKVDYEVSGAVSNIPKFEEFKSLKNKTTIVQIQAGGAGIELQYNSEVIFFSPTYSYQDYDQAIGRAYRIGQNNKVTVYKYISKKSIEEKIYSKLDEKKDFVEKLLSIDDL